MEAGKKNYIYIYICKNKKITITKENNSYKKQKTRGGKKRV
jgi:hypothetical protein